MKRGLGGQVVSLGFRMSWEISIKIQIGWEGGNWGAEVLQHWPHRSVTQYLLCTAALGELQLTWKQDIALHPSITGSEISLYLGTARSIYPEDARPGWKTMNVWQIGCGSYPKIVFCQHSQADCNWAAPDLHLFKWKEYQTFSRNSNTGCQERAVPAAPGVVEILNFKLWSAGDLSVTCWTKTQAQEKAGASSRMKK